MSTGNQYEFTEEQNKDFADLAGKMRFVGFFSVAFGILALLICLFTVLFMFRDRLPSGFREKAGEYLEKVKEEIPEDLRAEASEYELDKIPSSNNFLTGIAIFTGLTGLIFLLQGTWTRSSATSFQKIVDTRGQDIQNLMNSVGSLRNMYGQIYFLLMLALLAGLVAVGLAIYRYFGN